MSTASRRVTMAETRTTAEETAVERYPNISDHGIIGDLQTAALVTTDGTIDFFCCPRFDSPSVFASLLDAGQGGYFSIKPAADGYVTRQLYLPNTGMLITRFMTSDGVGEVLDFMPVIEGKPTDRHRLVRLLQVARGTMRFEMEIQPRFDYGRASHTMEQNEAGAVFRTEGGMHLTVHTAGRRRAVAEGGAEVERAGDGLRATFTLREGESGRGVVLESMGGEPQSLSPEELDQLADDTAAYWKNWLGRSAYLGRWRETVSRSAITLKLLTYEPTGAPVAAATFGLPEQAGGERNWDYRFTWVRDGSLTMHALTNLGYLEEAGRFATWIRDRVTEQAGEASPDRQRRGRPAAIGHLRRGHGRALRRHRVRTADRPSGVAVAHRDHRLGRRPLGPARRGDLGDSRRPPGLHLRPLPVLGRTGQGNPHSPAHRPPSQHHQVGRRTGPTVRPDQGPRLE
jgi:GH15 family glucan-1,4-alpha-glucosidase